MENNQNKRIEVGTPACGLLCAAVGVIIAFLLIFLGFFKTLLIAALAGLGYFIGACENKGELFKKVVDRFVPRKGE